MKSDGLRVAGYGFSRSHAPAWECICALRKVSYCLILSILHDALDAGIAWKHVPWKLFIQTTGIIFPLIRMPVRIVGHAPIYARKMR